MKQILNMELGDVVKVRTSDDLIIYRVVRVPGGWLFHHIVVSDEGSASSTTTFVPHTSKA